MIPDMKKLAALAAVTVAPTVAASAASGVGPAPIPGFVAHAAPATPRATARRLLTTCEKAINSVPIVALEPNTAQVPKANRRAQAAFHKCGTDAPWLKLNRKNKALHDAYYAWFDLASGIGDYMTYCGNVAFDHTSKSILHRAQREITRGRKEAKHALGEL